MKHSLLILFFSIPIFLFSQVNNKILSGRIDSIYSEILQEDRAVWIHVPESDYEIINKDKKYPVLYLLDGPGHFHAVVGMIKHLSNNTLCPDMIVVAIPNTNRTRDLTPSKPTSEDPADSTFSAFFAESGGGEAFLNFMEEELMPYIEEEFPVAPYRIFVGHSLGGLIVMHAFLKHTPLFNAYISIDPSMWWDQRNLLNEIKATAIDEKFDRTALFVGIGNTMETGMDTLLVQQDTSEMTDHIRAILDMDKYFLKNNTGELNYSSAYYPADDHGSVPFITEYDALRHIFDYYKLSITPKDVEDSDSPIFERIVDHFKNITAKLGYEVKPEEGMVNWMGYNFLRSKNLEMAYKFFKLNVDNYPNSWNVYDSIGDYYMAAENIEMARQHYEKSIELNDNSPSKGKFANLEKEKE